MKKDKVEHEYLLAPHDALIDDSIAWSDLMIETDDEEKKLQYVKQARAISKHVETLDKILGIELNLNVSPQQIIIGTCRRLPATMVNAIALNFPCNPKP